MEFPVTLTYRIDAIPGSPTGKIVLNSAFTVLVGPNGSGKTQILRALRPALRDVVRSRKIRFLSAGRLAHLETFRSNFDGHRGSTPNYDDANFGGKSMYLRVRHEIETALGDFHTLSARPDLQIKVAERLRRLFRRDLFIEWDAGNLRVSFTRLGSPAPYSSAREASGLLHLVVLLAALHDDEVGALLVDEPEISLHPQLQRFLLQEIRSVAGDPNDPAKKLVIVGTHSTEMIDVRRPEDLANLVFCCDVGVSPRQVDPTMGELQNRRLRSLISRMGQEHKLAFFCSRPLLVEGPSDAIICGALDRRLGLHLQAAGVQILPVIGKGQMPVVVKLMRLIGKSPIVLADIDAIADGLELVDAFQSEPLVNQAAQAKGHADVCALARPVYSAFCQMVEERWSEIEHRAASYFDQQRADGQSDSLLKRRAALCALMHMSDQERLSLPSGSDWNGIHARFRALLDILEAGGCFVLRRGSIESYFGGHSERSVEAKPVEAADEGECLEDEDTQAIEMRYSDVLRALRFAAATQPVDEVAALRDMVLAVAAPALAGLTKETTQEELDLLARRLLGDKATLLQMSVDAQGGTPELVIGLKSRILDATRFPVRLEKGCNPVWEVNRQLSRIPSDV